MNTNTARTPDKESPDDRGAGAFLPYRPLRQPMREDAILARIDAMRNAGIKPLTMAIESKLELNTLEGWIKGQRSKEVTQALSDWLTGVDDEIAALEGEFVMTPTSARIVKAIEQARAPRGKEGRGGIAL